jgi:sigma-B regulation protein RsbU (phosphoserine phosphatase)
VSYESGRVTLGSDNVLVVYSDGVTDATNSYDEPFGVDRLIAVIEANRELPSEALVDAILKAVAAHAAETPQFDDLTVVALKRTV